MTSDEFRTKSPLRSQTAMAEPGVDEQAASEPLDLVEVVGQIKWFDVAKGYGFIVPDDGKADVLLHVTVLRRDGYETAHEGARIVVEALDRARGLQAFRIVSMDESTALHTSQLRPSRANVVVEPTSGLERVVVKWFNRLRGFGFLSQGEGSPDIFVHMETLRKYGFMELKPGQYVMVRYGTGPKGLTASEIRPLQGSQVPVTH